MISSEQKIPEGTTGFLRITPEHGVVEIGHIHFSEKVKRTPVATESTYLMLKHAFDQWLASSNFDDNGMQRERLSDLTGSALTGD